jgi:hypothetical protein
MREAAKTARGTGTRHQPAQNLSMALSDKPVIHKQSPSEDADMDPPLLAFSQLRDIGGASRIKKMA